MRALYPSQGGWAPRVRIDGENLILEAKVFKNMVCHLILIKHFAEKMILHKKDLPNFSENLRPNLVLAAQILYSIGMKLLS